MLLLAVAGARHEVHEARAVAALAACAKDTAGRDYWGALVAYMATAIGYGSGRALVRAHIGAVVERWIADGDAFDARVFPYEALGYGSAQSFVDDVMPGLLLPMVKARDAASLRMLAECYGLTVAALLDTHLTDVLVVAVPGEARLLKQLVHDKLVDCMLRQAMPV
jgi:hypothetical protein